MDELMAGSLVKELDMKGAFSLARTNPVGPLALHEGCSSMTSSLELQECWAVPEGVGLPFSGVAASGWADGHLLGCVTPDCPWVGPRQMVSDLCPRPAWGECAHWAPTLRQPDTYASAGQLSEQSRCLAMDVPREDPHVRAAQDHASLLPAWVIRGAHTRCSESGVMVLEGSSVISVRIKRKTESERVRLSQPSDRCECIHAVYNRGCVCTGQAVI